MARPADFSDPFPNSVAGSILRSHQGSQVLEAVGCYEACGYKLPESRFNFRFEASGCPHHVWEKQRAALLQEFEHSLRHGTQERCRRILGPRMMRAEPIGILANK